MQQAQAQAVALIVGQAVEGNTRDLDLAVEEGAYGGGEAECPDRDEGVARTAEDL